MWQVNVQTLQRAHLDVCALVTLRFDHQPKVREILQQVNQNTEAAVRVFCWEEEVALDDLIPHESLISITDQAADRLREMRQGKESQDRRERIQALLDRGIDERNLAQPL